MGNTEALAIDRLLAEAPVIKYLPSDTEWEKLESAFAKESMRGIAPIEE
jgi:hypothetical protein